MTNNRSQVSHLSSQAELKSRVIWEEPCDSKNTIITNYSRTGQVTISQKIKSITSLKGWPLDQQLTGFNAYISYSECGDAMPVCMTIEYAIKKKKKKPKEIWQWNHICVCVPDFVSHVFIFMSYIDDLCGRRMCVYVALDHTFRCPQFVCVCVFVCVWVFVCETMRNWRPLLSLCRTKEHKSQIKENNSTVKAAAWCHSSY